MSTEVLNTKVEKDPAVIEFANYMIEKSKNDYKGEPYVITILGSEGDEVLLEQHCPNKLEALKFMLNLHGLFNSEQIVDHLTHILEEFKDDLKSR